MDHRIIELLRQRTRVSFPVEEDDRTFEMLLAACALLLELASADGEFTHEERKRIYALFRDEYQMFTEDIEELIDLTEQAVGYGKEDEEFTAIVNAEYSIHEKMHLVELMWKIVFADGVLDERESKLVETLAGKLGISHKEIRNAGTRTGFNPPG
ncbi:MAG: TerB family tellurite resistance protein [Bacteroidota bacterium]